MSDIDDVEATQVDVSDDLSLPEEKGKKKKKRKGAKKVSTKKLPRFLKKNIKASKIEKKLYKKIYVTSDKTLLKSLYEENPDKPGYLYIPRDKMIDKYDFKRLKLVSKDVRKQRGSFRLVPFVAVVAIVVALYTAVVTFKNPLAKKGLVFLMQKIFGARTDIAWVNVEFLKATITIGNLQQANKNSPMKNLFQIDKAEISFNLTEALRGKFDARNIEVTGLALNTDRTYSGELPPEPSEPNPALEAFMAEVNQRKDAALEAARKSIEDAFAEYNPANMIENVKDNLKSPEVAKSVQSQVEEAVYRWKSKPAEIQKQVEDFSSNTNAFVNDINVVLKKDFGKMNNPADVQNTVEQIKTMIEQTNGMIKQSKEMKNSVKTLADDIKNDSKKVKELSNQVTDALKNDTALVKAQLDKITSFNLDTGTRILGNAIDSAVYAALGNYYPYVMQGVNYAMELKAKSAQSSKEDQKKAALLQPRHERFAGKDIYWRKNTVPKFLIENIQFSGLGVAAKGTEISSDMDRRGAPATLNASYDQSGERTHKAQIVVDARTNTSKPLVGIEYSGDNYPFKFSTPYLNLDSNTLLVATCAVDKTGAVSIGAKFDMGTLLLTSDEFEPAIAYRFYSSALEEIKALVLEAQIGIDADRKLFLKIDSDLDQRFNTVLKNVVNKELKVLIADAQQQLTKLLNEQCGGVMDKVSEFVNLENGINAQSLNIDKINKVLEEKKAELEAKLKEQASSAINDALKNSGISLPSTNAEIPSSKEDAAKEALGGAIKGFLKK